MHLLIIFKNVQSLHLITFKHSEFGTFKLKKYYIWRAALGNISKKTNKFSHYSNYLNAGIFKSDLSKLQIYGLF